MRFVFETAFRRDFLDCSPARKKSIVLVPAGLATLKVSNLAFFFAFFNRKDWFSLAVNCWGTSMEILLFFYLSYFTGKFTSRVRLNTLTKNFYASPAIYT